MDSFLQKKISTLLPQGESLKSITKLFGEASYREYFRLFTESNSSFILMKIPAGKQSVSEEITNYQGPKDELPFLNMARYLESSELPVPKIFATDLRQGLLLLQDLGDKTLEKVLESCNEDMCLFFYRQAIELLLKFQKAGEEICDESCMAFKRSFDEHLLMWEFEHFIEYGIEDRFGIKINDKKRQKLLQLAHELIHPITKIPYGLTHRDFQSRNLLLYGYDFYLIDFQDALMGPPQYDLVALLRDSYVELPFAQVEVLIRVYLAGRKEMGLSELDEKEFIKNFHRVTLQRKLKDAGRFQFIHTKKSNSNFLPHVPTTLRYIKTAFEHLPELSELQTNLVYHVKEIA